MGHSNFFIHKTLSASARNTLKHTALSVTIILFLYGILIQNLCKNFDRHQTLTTFLPKKPLYEILSNKLIN